MALARLGIEAGAELMGDPEPPHARLPVYHIAIRLSHPRTTFPHSQNFIARLLARVPKADGARVVGGACKQFSRVGDGRVNATIEAAE